MGQGGERRCLLPEMLLEYQAVPTMSLQTLSPRDRVPMPGHTQDLPRLSPGILQMPTSRFVHLSVLCHFQSHVSGPSGSNLVLVLIPAV